MTRHLNIKRVSAEEFAKIPELDRLAADAFKDGRCPGTLSGFDLNLYRQLDKHNMSLLLIAYDGDEVAGWCGGYLTSDTYGVGKFMMQESIYIKPEYRNTMLPGRLIKRFEAEARTFNSCTGVLWSACPGSPFERTLDRHYKLYSKNYVRLFL